MKHSRANWSKYVQIISGNSMRSLAVIQCVSGMGEGTIVSDMAEDQGFQEVFRGLGREWRLSNELYRDLQRFTCAMYRKSAGTNEVNELRYRFFCWRKGTVDFN